MTTIPVISLLTKVFQFNLELLDPPKSWISLKSRFDVENGTRNNKLNHKSMLIDLPNTFLFILVLTAKICKMIMR